jgi:hypothetical protein
MSKKKNKPLTDEELLARCAHEQKAVQERREYEREHHLTEDAEYDLLHELCCAIALRDYNIAEKKIQRSMTIHQVVFYLFQFGLAWYIYTRWDDISLKLLILLLVIMLSRSINFAASKRSIMQTASMLLQVWAHPTAKDDFFSTKHCYGLGDVFHKGCDLLRKANIPLRKESK